MSTKTQKQISARRLAILLLLAATNRKPEDIQPISGTTRIQKLLFLVSRKTELALRNSTYFRFDFNYEPEKFGPADLDLYQDLDFLRTMNLVALSVTDRLELTAVPTLPIISPSTKGKAPALLPEEREEEELSFEYLIGSEPMELLAADTEVEGERQYYITESGLDLVENIRSQSVGDQKKHFDALEEACTEVRQQFGDWTLRRLLKYVYENYEDMTTRSTIRDQVKGSF